MLKQAIENVSNTSPETFKSWTLTRTLQWYCTIFIQQRNFSLEAKSHHNISQIPPSFNEFVTKVKTMFSKVYLLLSQKNNFLFKYLFQTCPPAPFMELRHICLSMYTHTGKDRIWFRKRIYVCGEATIQVTIWKQSGSTEGKFQRCATECPKT